jgi:putative membrane protein
VTEPPPPAPEQPPPPEPEAPPWLRLDQRMLLVQPAQELVRFLPVLLGLVIFGSATGGPWGLIGVAVPVVLGVARYLTTSFRITHDRVELRRGVLERHLLSTPLDRVRTVDLTASPIHRMLGLSTVRIGTGTASTDSDERIDLDGVPTPQAEALRARLLEVAAPETAAGDDETAAPETLEVARFSPRWLAYAPFTSGGLAIAGAIVAIATQVSPRIEIDTDEGLPAYLEWWWALALVAVLLIGLLTLVAYASAYWGMAVTRASADAPWRIRRGLFTTRETSIDPERLSGVTLRDPLPLRWARGARLQAIVTGIRSGGSDAAPGSTLVPPAPREVALSAAATMVADPEVVRRPLAGHGPRATVRRYTRALLPAGVLAAAAGTTAVATDTWWLLAAAPVLLVVAAALAWDRARSLGHRLSDGLLVSRSGSLSRRRDVLATDHVIGWTFRATWFQRRAGLTDAAATIAGGDQQVRVIDVPEDAALCLARTATPCLLEQFIVTDPPVPTR